MKSPEEIYNNITFQPIHKEPMISLIKKIQKDAYNNAILEVYKRLKYLKYIDACYSIRNFEM